MWHWWIVMKLWNIVIAAFFCSCYCSTEYVFSLCACVQEWRPACSVFFEVSNGGLWKDTSAEYGRVMLNRFYTLLRVCLWNRVGWESWTDRADAKGILGCSPASSGRVGPLTSLLFCVPEASKLVMSYVAAVCGKGQEVNKVKEQLLQSNPVLEGRCSSLDPQHPQCAACVTLVSAL